MQIPGTILTPSMLTPIVIEYTNAAATALLIASPFILAKAILEKIKKTRKKRILQ